MIEAAATGSVYALNYQAGGVESSAAPVINPTEPYQVKEDMRDKIRDQIVRKRANEIMYQFLNGLNPRERYKVATGKMGKATQKFIRGLKKVIF